MSLMKRGYVCKEYKELQFPVHFVLCTNKGTDWQSNRETTGKPLMHKNWLTFYAKLLIRSTICKQLIFTALAVRESRLEATEGPTQTQMPTPLGFFTNTVVAKLQQPNYDIWQRITASRVLYCLKINGTVQVELFLSVFHWLQPHQTNPWASENSYFNYLLKYLDALKKIFINICRLA